MHTRNSTPMLMAPQIATIGRRDICSTMCQSGIVLMASPKSVSSISPNVVQKMPLS